jgi:hypothetical protein
MSKNRIVKPVSFNLEKESKIIEHINQYDNFSSYVKYLIINDMNSNNNILELIKSVENIKDILNNKIIHYLKMMKIRVKLMKNKKI